LLNSTKLNYLTFGYQESQKSICTENLAFLKFYMGVFSKKLVNLSHICGMWDLLYQKIGFTISSATMGRMAKLLNMTFKKKLSFRARKALTEFKTGDISSGKKSEKFVSKT
jgi:hypothetical protein